MFIKRIGIIKQYLIENNIDGYVIQLNDDHGSEYVPNRYKTIAFLTNFTGSNAILIITQKESYLWTDGRYFIQAKQQLEASNVKLMRIGIDEDIISFIIDNMSSLAFDFKTTDTLFVANFMSRKPELKLIDDGSIIDEIWLDRPKVSKKKVFLLPEDKFILSAKEKCHRTISNIKTKDKKYGVLVSALDDIAWILNARGKDVTYNPVFIAFMFLVKNENTEYYNLYIDSSKLTKEIKEKLIKENITIKPYNSIYKDIGLFTYKVYYDCDKTNYKLFSLMSHPRNKTLWPTIKKSIKTSVDIKETKKAHIKDAIAMCKFIYYVKNNAAKGRLSEISIAKHLEKLRKKQGAFDLSFSTIVGYKEHGAIVHYSATKETNKTIQDDGLLLVDSGGQYYYGTTDITRTIALKNITEEMKYHFTLVLKCHIDLAMAVFSKNTTGAELDYIARKTLWDVNLDFNHGTGHGVGHMLNVHEGPQNINYKRVPSAIMKKGMITSDEPGLYLENKYGIRHENELLCIAIDKEHLGFEPLTYVPFDLDAIDVNLLDENERNYLNNYHKMVYNKIEKYLNKKEKEFLLNATREI